MAARDLKGANGVLSYFTRHRTLANLLLVLMVVAGIWAAPKMRAQFFPDIIVDSVTVSVRWDGAGAEDVDRAIVQLIEPALTTVQGVTETSARSTEGSARIRLEFEPGWDMARAEEDVAAVVDGIGDLPESAEDPTVSRNQWSDRVTDVIITGPVGVDQLARFADETVLRLREAGVTQTTIRGVAAPETLVEVTSLSLIRNDVTMAEIASAISAAADTNPAGDVSGSARVRAGVERRSAEDIEAVVLRTNADGSQLTVGDVATITVGGVDRDRAYFVGENPAISMQIDRSDRGDAIDIQRRVEEVTAEVQAGLPQGVSMDLIRGRAEYITGRLDILLENGLLGLGLVVGLLFLFLNARTALWVALGIPVAMSAAVFLMYMGGLTFNMISLFALIITLGIVVDDAIVVGEHADFRARRLGESPVAAAENAAKRMFTPVFSATLTTIIAFFGLVAIGGRFGEMIADIPFTVIAVLIASLVECFLILPNHMSHAVGGDRKWYDWPSRQVNRGFGWVRDTLFRPLMQLVIWARYPVLAGVILILAGQVSMMVTGQVQWRFFSSPEQGSVTGNFAMLPAADRDDTIEMMREMQRAVEEVAAAREAETGVNPVAYVIAEIGGNAGRGLSGADTKEPDQLGAISIELIELDLRPDYTSFAFTADLQEAVRQHPLAETVSFRSWGGGPGGDDIDVELSGSTPEVLKEAAEELKTELGRFAEVTALEDSLAYDKEELVLQLTPQGEALGFSIDGIGAVLRDRLGGIEAASFPDGTRSATIRVELPDKELTADFLDRAQMRTEAGTYLPLTDIVSVERRTGFSTLTRDNGVLLISVNGDLTDDDPDRAAEIMTQLQDDILPRIEERFGIDTSLSGLAEQERDFLSDATFGAIMVLLGIYLTLAWIFASWTRPLVVMAIIPFGLVGAIYGHNAWGVPMSIFSVVGLIGMIGIIINDSIVLVTTIDEYARDRGLIPAIVDGAADRLRAVLLTTLTTVLGLAPLLYEQSSQAEFLKPTVITLVYGLGFGMVLVLIVVPALLAMQQDVAKQVTAVRRSLRAPSAVAVPVWAAVAGVLALFAAVVVPVAVTGAPWPVLAAVAPGGLGGALGVFLLGTAVLLVAVWLLSALLRGIRLHRAA